jgi:hypothetical protein
VFENFYKSVCELLEKNEKIKWLLQQHGDDFDSHVSNELLGRGQTVCDTALLGQLYAYRYAPMHFFALRKVLPCMKCETRLIDFGTGPGTALLASADKTDQIIHHVGLEIAEGMRLVCEDARTLLASRIGESVSHALPGKAFWEDAEGSSPEQQRVFMFSYFFGQDLNASFVQGLAKAIQSIQGTNTAIVYTNPVGPHASWMPNSDIHHWYRRFCEVLGHEPKITTTAYSYEALSNLAQRTIRSGEFAYEVWSLA